MALIVKSSIDILPWTEIEKQKLIEDKKEFLSKIKAEEVKEEVKEEETVEENKKVKSSTDKKQNKKEVKE